MLLFSTILSINKKMTKDAFIRLVIEWNQGSPHKQNIIPGLEWHGERNIRYGTDTLWLAIEEYRNQNIIAVRYEKTEADGVVWDTDYVLNFNDMQLSIQLDRSYLAEALVVAPAFSTPHFITLLIEKDYLQSDGMLPVLRNPILIDSSNVALLADVINEQVRYRLPVVYISKTSSGEDPVDIGRLAGRLKGVAHVLVAADCSLDMQLRELCADKNEFHGAVGIYYPNASVGHRSYMYHAYAGIDAALSERVIRSVIHYCNSQLMAKLYTWQGVNNAILRDRLLSQREERLAAEQAQKAAENKNLQLLDYMDASKRQIQKQAMEMARYEADKLLDSFEEEMTQLQEKVNELTRANDILQYENQGLKAKLSEADAVPLLYLGDEYEFFCGEIKELVLATLADALPNIQPQSRRADVIRDIIGNNDFQKLGENRAEIIKKQLRSYDCMSKSLRRTLEEFGFEIADDGKHYKVTYYGDGRYQTVFGKTPSDNRAGNNNAARIIKMAY